MKNRRRLVVVPLAAAAVVLAFASVAYACTIVVGSITSIPAGGQSVVALRFSPPGITSTYALTVGRGAAL